MTSPSRRPPQPLFYPKFLTSLKTYTPAKFLADLTSGVIVGIVALPLAIAFAIASGVTPERGLTTAILAGFLISALGGSLVQIGGPTGAFVVIVYRIVEQRGVDGLILCTLLAGVILILMGLFRLGDVIKFIPYPLTVGFTSGIAVIIFSQQVGDLLGLTTGKMPSDFLDKWAVYMRCFHTAQPATVVLAAVSLLILGLWPRINRRIPASIVAIIAATAAVRLLHLNVETIGSRFGALPIGLPAPVLPALSLARLRPLVGPAFTVAMLGAIESLLSATVADGMIEGRHRSNTELIAQGVANIVSPLFGGIPATGAIARTATNVKNGGRTPVAGMVHSLTLLLIVLLFGRWASLIPLCVLAAILVVVSYHMSEWHAFRSLLRAPRTDVAVLVITFLLTVFVDLTVAVEVGMLASLVLFMKRMSDVTYVREAGLALKDGEDHVPHKLPAGVMVFEAEGAFFFGVAESLRDILSVDASADVVILRMDHVLALDASGLRALNDVKRSCARRGAHLLLSGLHTQPLAAIIEAGEMSAFGRDHVFATFGEALSAAKGLVTRFPVER